MRGFLRCGKRRREDGLGIIKEKEEIGLKSRANKSVNIK
jgi:hypothetical protein